MPVVEYELTNTLGNEVTAHLVVRDVSFNILWGSLASGMVSFSNLSIEASSDPNLSAAGIHKRSSRSEEGQSILRDATDLRLSRNLVTHV